MRDHFGPKTYSPLDAFCAKFLELIFSVLRLMVSLFIITCLLSSRVQFYHRLGGVSIDHFLLEQQEKILAQQRRCYPRRCLIRYGITQSFHRHKWNKCGCALEGARGRTSQTSDSVDHQISSLLSLSGTLDPRLSNILDCWPYYITYLLILGKETLYFLKIHVSSSNEINNGTINFNLCCLVGRRVTCNLKINHSFLNKTETEMIFL